MDQPDPAVLPGPTPGLATARVGEWVAELARAATSGSGVDDAGRVDLLRALEELKCAAAGVQAVVTVELDDSQRGVQAAAGVPAGRRGRGVAAQVGLARRESPHRGGQHLGLARVLVAEMPCTLAALAAGRITEWRATILARETACVSREHRTLIDQALAGDPRLLERLGERELAAEAVKLVCLLDPESLVARRRRARADRCVTGRPAPDVMMRLSALLPVAEGVSVVATLTREADRLRATGDPRSRGQIMADTLVARVTGAIGPHAGPDAHTADDPVDGPSDGPVVPVAVNLVISDAGLLAGADDAAYVEGYGPVPAELARELVAANLDAGSRVWLRRLYARPRTGELVAVDSRSRLFRVGLRGLLRLRDQTCRTPWCDAPVRQGDHAESHGEGGATSQGNGQGLCQGCNLAKQAHGWRARPRPGPRHTVQTQTPSGHRYDSTAPPILGSRALTDLDWLGHLVRVRTTWNTLVRAA